MKCPGQDSRYWGADAAFEVDCPACGETVELFRDESRARCPACGFRFRNPRLDLGCAEWCPSASACLGSLDGTGALGERSLVDDLIALVREEPEIQPAERELALSALVQTQSLLLEQAAEPRLTMLATLLSALAEPMRWTDRLQAVGLSLLEVSTAASIAEGSAADNREAETRLVQDALALARFDLRARAGGPDAAGAPQPPEQLHSRTAEKLAREIARRRGIDLSASTASRSQG